MGLLQTLKIQQYQPGCLTTNPKLTSWPHLAPAFYSQKNSMVDVSWSCFSQLMMRNNICIAGCVKHLQIHFCFAVLIATYKQRNYRCPSSSSYTPHCCALYSTVVCCINMIVWQYGSRCCEHQTIQNGLGAVITWELGHHSSPLTSIDCFEWLLIFWLKQWLH